MTWETHPLTPDRFVDGAFGSGTKSAVVSFQSANGLSADGIVGLNTWAQLVS